MQRQKAVLAGIRLRGHHTYDLLAQAMVNIHYKFHIEKKVTRSTTDNSSNFVKAFVQFGAEDNTLADLPVVQNLDTNPADAAEATLLAGSVDEQELEYVSLAVPDDIDAVIGNPINLPAYTFNLLASKDADAALQSAVFQEAHTGLPLPRHMPSGTTRIAALWQQTTSTLSGEEARCPQHDQVELHL